MGIFDGRQNARMQNCKNCRQMETDVKNFRCAVADEIHEEMFEGKLPLCLPLIPYPMPHSFQDIYSGKLSLHLI